MTREERIQAMKVMMTGDGWREIVKPALRMAISNLEGHWLNGTRPKGEERLTDEALKGRIWSFVWMQGWGKRLDLLVEQVEAEADMASKSEDMGEGGGPY